MTKHRNTIYTPAQRKRARSNSDSDTASSDMGVAVADNQDLIVSVREARTTASKRKVILLSISNSRPDSAFGKIQGDHVTAYKSFLEMLLSAVEGKHIRKATQIIANVAKALLPDKVDLFENILLDLERDISDIISRERRYEIIQDLKEVKNPDGSFKYDSDEIRQMKESLELSKRYVFMKAAERIGQEFIQQVNLDEETAFKKERQPDRSEGARVKKAIHALKAANDLKAIYDMDSVSEVILDRFYTKYIEVGAPYKDGANVIFGHNSVKNLKNFKSKPFENKKSSLLRLYNEMQKDKIGELLGNLFGELFDFNYAIHGHRTKDIRLLSRVTAKHIIVMFHAFDELQSFDAEIRQSMIDHFLNDKVLQDQGWSNAKSQHGRITRSLTLESLKESINNYMDLSEFRILSESEVSAKISGNKGGRGR